MDVDGGNEDVYQSLMKMLSINIIMTNCTFHVGSSEQVDCSEHRSQLWIHVTEQLNWKLTVSNKSGTAIFRLSSTLKSSLKQLPPSPQVAAAH
jgi:hypothetical protein